MADLEQAVSRVIDEFLSPSDRIVVAVSGGSDSLGLLHLFASVIDTDKLMVGFVDHGLRPGVDLEWELVSKHAHALGVRATYLSVEAVFGRERGHREGLQQWARERRYEVLGRLAENDHANVIATGHTADDQAETVLLRILRGTGLDGLAAIHPLRATSGGMRIFRPLLGISRTAIRQWLEARHVEWIEDPSNDNSRFARVRVRRDLLPLMNRITPRATDHLCALANDARGVTSGLNDRLPAEADVYRDIALHDGVKVSSDILARCADVHIPLMVREAIRRVKGNLRQLERSHVEAICAGIQNGNGTRLFSVPGDMSVCCMYGSLYVFAIRTECLLAGPTHADRVDVCQGEETLKEVVLHIPGISVKVSLSRASGARLPGVRLRLMDPKDRLYNRRTSLRRLLSKKKIPRFYRPYVPVLCNDAGVVLAVPLVFPCAVSGMDVQWQIASDTPMADLGSTEMVLER